MAIRTLAGNLKLQGDYDEGFTGWGAGMNENLQKLSFMVQPAVKDLGITTPPVSPVQGDMYILGAGASLSAWGLPSSTAEQRAMNAQSLVAYDGGGWKHFAPQVGVMVYNTSEGLYYKYTGTAWITLLSYLELRDIPNPYSPPDPQWWKASLASNTALSTSNRLISSSSSYSGSSDRIFNSSGRCISPGLYDIRFQANIGKVLVNNATAVIQINVGGANVSEAGMGVQNFSPTPFTLFTQTIAQISQNDVVDFNTRTSGSGIYQATGGAVQTFASVHRIR